MDERDRLDLLDEIVDTARWAAERPVFDRASEDETLRYSQDALPGGDRLQRHQRRRLILDEFAAAPGALPVNPAEIAAARDRLRER